MQGSCFRMVAVPWRITVQSLNGGLAFAPGSTRPRTCIFMVGASAFEVVGSELG